MKQYYVTSCVCYTDTIDGKKHYKKAYYSKILSANSLEEADHKMEEESLETFNKELNDNYTDIYVILAECYEMSDCSKRE